MSIRIHLFCGTLVAALSLAAPAQSADVGALYRCPGNDYNNTLSAGEAEKLHCKRVENAPVSVIQSAGPRPVPPASGAAAASSAPSTLPVAEVMTPSDSAALRTRASNARRQLETKLRSEERRLSALETEFNGGEPERQLEEIDLPKYLDRVARMRSAISRKQIEIAELRREIGKLPSP